MPVIYSHKPFYEDIERANFQDVDEKVINFMVKMLDKCEEENRLVIWKDFKDYCMSFGKEPHVLCVPECVIDRCIIEARKRTKYKLAK